MPRFELEFGVGLDDGGGGIINTGLVTRVIFAEDQEMAKCVGSVMVWRKVPDSGFLSKLFGVKEVSHDVEYSPPEAFDCLVWAEALEELGLRPDDVDYVLEEDMKRKFIVGFRLKAIELEPIDEE